MLVVQQILNGVVVGSVYVLFALGFTLIFGVQRVLNMAHGAVFMCGAFAGLIAMTYLDLWFPVALVLAIVIAGALSVVLDYVAFRPLRKRGAPQFAAIVSSIGAALILINVAQRASDTLVWRYPFGAFPVQFFDVFGVRISLLQLTIVGCAWAAVLGLLALLAFTNFGRQVRAVAIDEGASQLLGINPEKTYFWTFFIAGGLAGMAGVLIGLAFNSVHFLMGEPYMLRAFVVVVLGGLGSIGGALVAGLILGIMQTLIIGFVSTGLSDAIIFSLLFLILLIRPAGLFGVANQEKRVTRE